MKSKKVGMATTLKDICGGNVRLSLELVKEMREIKTGRGRRKPTAISGGKVYSFSKPWGIGYAMGRARAYSEVLQVIYDKAGIKENVKVELLDM